MKDGWYYLRPDKAEPVGPFLTKDMAAAAEAHLAFDRASVRTYDKDGRLHVAISHISKANICEYYGREIPKWRDLGLSPHVKYKLLRDPEELKKAAHTFNNLPLLSRHVHVTAFNHQPELVIGSTGTDAEFNDPYLDNSLVIWPAAASAAVEEEVQRELSSAYHYDADMTPGVYKGEPYDGRMINIVGNHVALVREGRAGDDVVVGDSKPEELILMNKTVLSRMAAVSRGALMAYLMPKLAMDAKVDLDAILKDVSAKNFSEKKPEIIAAVRTAVAGKLAMDASIEDVVKLVDALEKEEVKEGLDADPNSGLPIVEEEELAKVLNLEEQAKDEDVDAKRREFLAGKLSDEDMKAYDAICGVAKDEEVEVTKTTEEPITQTAMDEAIKATEARVRDGLRKTREAENAVRPYVGDMAIAFDSAEDVYRGAFKILGVDVNGVDPSAYPTILKLTPNPKAKKQVQLGMDAKPTAGSAADFSKRFPGAERIRSV